MGTPVRFRVNDTPLDHPVDIEMENAIPELELFTTTYIRYSLIPDPRICLIPVFMQ